MDAYINSSWADAWITKGVAAAGPFLTLSGAASVGRTVRAEPVDGPQNAPLGNFMLTWPERRTQAEVIRYLPDANFFLRLLRQTYGPALRIRPDLGWLILDRSRVEVAFTNDVLQVQLRTVANGYSMIRHHALMLFYGTLWLDPEASAGWFDLYRTIAATVVARSPMPTREALDAVEVRAFSDFARLAPRSVASPDELLADRNALSGIREYFIWAAVAVAAVERDYRETQPAECAAWHRGQMTEGYRSVDYPMGQIRGMWEGALSHGGGHS